MDAEQLATLIDRHAGALALYASQWSSAADDIVQQAFIRLLEQEKTPDPPLPWLFAVVRNLALTDRRSHQRRQRRQEIAGRLRARCCRAGWGVLKSLNKSNVSNVKLPFVPWGKRAIVAPESNP